MKRIILFVVFMGLLSSVVAQQTAEQMVRYTRYLLYQPTDIEPPYPMIVFLHGGGERGDDLELVKKNGIPAFLDDTTGFPFVVVSPQCPAGTRWDVEMLEALIDHVVERVPIDLDRIYLTGLSMGGEGTWDLAMAEPDRFAAIAPVCGRNTLDNVCAVKHMPTWVFHGAMDDVVRPEYSDRIVDTLEAMGAPVKYTRYPEANHNSWDLTYSNPELYAWFLSHRRGSETLDKQDQMPDGVTGVFSNPEYGDVVLKAELNTLILESPNGYESRYKYVKPGLYRRPGPYRDDRDLELQFGVDNRIEGFTVGPCVGIYFERKE